MIALLWRDWAHLLTIILTIMKTIMRQWLDKFIGDEHGANLIEMALVTMLLLIIMAGAADVGRAFNNYIIITNAAREGARTAARLPCKDDNRPQLRAAIVGAVLREATDSGVILVGGDVTIAPDPVGTGCAAAGAPVSVTVDYRTPTVMGGILGMNQIPMQSAVQMVFFGND